MAETPSSDGPLSPSLIFLAFMLLIFFLWIAEGGASRPLSFGGPFLTAPSTGSYSESYGPGGTPTVTTLRFPTFSLGNSSSFTPRSDGESAQNPLPPPQPTNRSSYATKVSIERRSGGAKQTQARSEYIVLSASKNNTEAIRISGWSLESVRNGRRIDIPLGTELPLSGLILEQEPVILKPGDKAYVVSGSSPIGASFRINMCMGYFEQYQDFTPSISRSCPRPIDELEEYYGGNLLNDERCEAFVKKISQCTLVGGIPPEISYECRAVIEGYLHYNGCVRAHQREKDFFDNEWRVYLDTTANLWREKRETIRLYDTEGKLVDEYTYE